MVYYALFSVTFIHTQLVSLTKKIVAFTYATTSIETMNSLSVQHMYKVSFPVSPYNNVPFTHNTLATYLRN